MNPTALSEKLLFATLRLEVEAPGGGRTGTGFLFSHSIERDLILPLLVTNKHVVENGTMLKTQIHRADGNGQPILSQSELITIVNPGQTFISHPNPDVDLCAFCVGPILTQTRAGGTDLFSQPLSSSLLPTEQKLDDLSAVEDVVMVGYPIGLWDAANNLPLIRRGITASHPRVDFDGKQLGLIDAACFPGSSGSPVLVLNEGTHFAKRGIVIVESRIILLGVLCSVPYYEPDGRIEVRTIPTSPTSVLPVPVIQQMVHLGFYVKAKAVQELAELIALRATSDT